MTRWALRHLGFDDAATVSQWNMRAYFATRSSFFAIRWPPITRNGQYVTFPLSGKADTKVITRNPPRRRYYRSETADRLWFNDDWFPKIECNHPSLHPSFYHPSLHGPEPETDSNSDCSNLNLSLPPYFP